MKKIIIFILIGLFINGAAYPANEKTAVVSITKADKKQYSKITKNPRLIEMLLIMKDSPAKFAYEKILGNNKSEKPIKLMFRDLTEISDKYKDYDAVGWKRGRRIYIYINSKHVNAPKEALCALITARTINDDEFDSINEEVECWMLEGMVWDYFVEKTPELENVQGDLVKRENTIRKIYLRGNKTDKYIRKMVKSNPGYSDFPETSPGFEN